MQCNQLSINCAKYQINKYKNIQYTPLNIILINMEIRLGRKQHVSSFLEKFSGKTNRLDKRGEFVAVDEEKEGKSGNKKGFENKNGNIIPLVRLLKKGSEDQSKGKSEEFQNMRIKSRPNVLDDGDFLSIRQQSQKGQREIMYIKRNAQSELDSHRQPQAERRGQSRFRRRTANLIKLRQGLSLLPRIDSTQEHHIKTEPSTLSPKNQKALYKNPQKKMLHLHTATRKFLNAEALAHLKFLENIQVNIPNSKIQRKKQSEQNIINHDNTQKSNYHYYEQQQ